MNDNNLPTQKKTQHAFFKGFCKTAWKDRKRLLTIQAWIVILAAYLFLGFAYLCPQDYFNESPRYVLVSWSAFMLRTFIYHLGLTLLLILLFALWQRQWKLLVACLPAVFIAAGPTWWQYRARSRPLIHGTNIAVMTVNLLMVNKDTNPIIGEIKEARPDILFLQEYTDHWHSAINDEVGVDYPHKVFIRREDSFGAAIYSRLPFVEDVERYMSLGSGNVPQIRAVVEMGGRHVAIYNIHFLPPLGMDYITETRKQFADLLDRLSTEDLPFIVAGDYNFTEQSPQAASLRSAGVIEAQDVGGWGRGTTWPNSRFFRWIPSIRLDHIYLSAELTCNDCRTGQGHGSDHRPVIAKVGFGS